MNLQEELYKIYLKSPSNLFDAFIDFCKEWYEVPAHSLGEINRRDNKKIRGDIFEEFSLLYLKYIKGYENSYLLKDVPQEILDKLNLKRRDMGIDIIVEDIDSKNWNQKYYAVQCKYKKFSNTKKNILSWKILSTFYALCLRTGPWDKYIIMTNCHGSSHQGKKTPKDISICIGTFRNITQDEWLRMAGKTGHTISEEVVKVKNPTPEELRELRLKHLKIN